MSTTTLAVRPSRTDPTDMLRVTPDWKRYDKYLIRAVMRRGATIPRRAEPIPLLRPVGPAAANGLYLPGGNVKPKETLLGALERESLEELGVHVVPLRHFFHLDYTTSEGLRGAVDFVEVAVVGGDGRYRLNKEENDLLRMARPDGNGGYTAGRYRIEWKSAMAIEEYARLM